MCGPGLYVLCRTCDAALYDNQAARPASGRSNGLKGTTGG